MEPHLYSLYKEIVPSHLFHSFILSLSLSLCFQHNTFEGLSILLFFFLKEIFSLNDDDDDDDDDRES
jgi:hypothetical protein